MMRAHGASAIRKDPVPSERSEVMKVLRDSLGMLNSVGRRLFGSELWSKDPARGLKCEGWI